MQVAGAFRVNLSGASTYWPHSFGAVSQLRVVLRLAIQNLDQSDSEKLIYPCLHQTLIIRENLRTNVESAFG
jgi:hypothetical protein